MTKITIGGEGSVRDIMFNGKVIAHAVCSEGGSFLVEFRDGGGWWDTWALREIADAIDALNKPWHDYMDYSFGCMQRGEKYMDWKEWSEQQKQGK